ADSQRGGKLRQILVDPANDDDLSIVSAVAQKVPGQRRVILGGIGRLDAQFQIFSQRLKRLVRAEAVAVPGRLRGEQGGRQAVGDQRGRGRQKRNQRPGAGAAFRREMRVRFVRRLFPVSEQN